LCLEVSQICNVNNNKQILKPFKKMKTIKKLSLMFAIGFATILSSCSKDEDPTTTSTIPATGTYINAKVDGADFTTIVAGQTAGSAVRNVVGGLNIILVSGSSVSLSDVQSQKNIALSLNNITAPGTYPLNGTSGNAGTYTDLNAGTTTTYSSTADCQGATGSVTVTAISATQIEGTFNFIGKKDGACSATKTVTEGSFRGVF
jgi:hypothetical protein